MVLNMRRLSVNRKQAKGKLGKCNYCGQVKHLVVSGQITNLCKECAGIVFPLSIKTNIPEQTNVERLHTRYGLSAM